MERFEIPSRILFRAFMATFLLQFAVGGAVGQTSQERPVSPASPYAERMNVRLITLPVLVLDRQGRAVTDLRADEIRIVEGKSRYAAAFVSPFYEGAEERRNLPQVRLMTKVPGEGVEVGGSTAREPRHLLVLLDLLNEPPVGRGEAMAALTQFLEKLDPSFQVGVMTFDGELRLRLPFTHDRMATGNALRAVAQERPQRRVPAEVRMEQLLLKLEACRIDEPDAQFEIEPRPTNSPGSGTADIRCLRDSMQEYAGEALPRALLFLEAIEGAIEYSAGLDDHAYILTIGGSVGMNPAREVAESMRALFGPMDEINQLEQQLYGEDMVRPHLDRVMQLAYRENASLTFLDRTPAPSDFSARNRSVMRAGFRPLQTAVHAAQQDVGEIAASTGGAFVSSTRVADGLEAALKLMEGGYHIGFYVEDDEPLTPRRIQKIKLESLRPGLVLKYRRAFDGVRKADAPAPRIRGIIQVGLPEQKEFQGVRGNIVPIRLVLDPRDLGYKETEARATADFTVHLRLMTPKRALLADSYHVLTHAYNRDVWNSGKLEPPDLLAWADLPDGDYFAEAVVTVPGLASRGTFRRHIAVRGVTTEPESSAGGSSPEPESAKPNSR